MTFDRTIPRLKRLIQAYFDATGQRPTTDTSPEWKNHNQWLRQKKTSIRVLCDELKLPGGDVWNRTLPLLKQLIQARFKATGERPTTKTSPEWANHDQWLRCQGTSLSTLCDELNLPGGRVSTRSIPQLKTLIQEHFNVTGKRPTKRTSSEWMNHENWLRGQGTSLYQLCDEMGLPGGPVMSRSIPQLKTLIQEYVKAMGQRPTLRTNSDWNCHHQWLQRRGSSLHQLCNEMGLPR